MSNDSNVIKVEKGHLQSWKLREKCIQTFILINSYGQKSWSYQCLGTALIITKKNIELCYEIRIKTYFPRSIVYSSRELVNDFKLGFKLNVYPHIFSWKLLVRRIYEWLSRCDRKWERGSVQFWVYRVFGRKKLSLVQPPLEWSNVESLTYFEIYRKSFVITTFEFLRQYQTFPKWPVLLGE